MMLIPASVGVCRAVRRSPGGYFGVGVCAHPSYFFIIVVLNSVMVSPGSFGTSRAVWGEGMCQLDVGYEISQRHLVSWRAGISFSLQALQAVNTAPRAVFHSEQLKCK